MDRGNHHYVARELTIVAWECQFLCIHLFDLFSQQINIKNIVIIIAVYTETSLT